MEDVAATVEVDEPLPQLLDAVLEYDRGLA
jgi:hypothetical protein